MGSLENKTIIITGGSLGIGLAISKTCAEEGATVIIAARNKTDLENALNELKMISDMPHRFYSLDISRIDEVNKFKDWCLDSKLEINGLVNCAGVYGPIGKSTEIDLEKFTEAIQINFLGTVYMCNKFAPILKSSSKKKIINYSGGGAAGPFPNYSAYATSKIAIVRFTENLSLELKEDNFEVNCIAPGFVVTRLHKETLTNSPDIVGKQFYESTKNQVEKGGVPPEKAAALTAFLLSDESNGITGKFISAPWDPWNEETFINKIKNENDFAVLRRIDNKNFYKKI